MRPIACISAGFALLTLSVVWLSCGDNDNSVNSTDFFAEEPFSFQVDIESQSRLRLEGIRGTVNVTGSPETTSVQITGKRRVESNSARDAEERLKDLDVDVQDGANEVFIKTIQPDDTHGRNYIVTYTITVPQDLEVQLRNITGEVTVHAIHTTVSIMAIAGDIRLDEIFGNTFVELATGSIDGHVTLPIDGILNLSTVTGSIDLEVPANTSAQLSANVIAGRISLSGLVLENQNSSSTSLSGTLGDGKGTITLSVMTGNISISGS